MAEEETVEARLRASQYFTRAIVEACLAALLVIDRNLAITDVNEQAVRIVRASRGEIIGSPLGIFSELPPKATEGVRRTLDSGVRSRFEVTCCARDGERRTVPIAASRFFDPRGEHRGLLATVS
ncbi:MAG: PAS domain-containing protein [Thermoplasmata archaeon]|nr:PAS domain-containing protein [Thermoplasmata archaeon]